MWFRINERQMSFIYLWEMGNNSNVLYATLGTDQPHFIPAPKLMRSNRLRRRRKEYEKLNAVHSYDSKVWWRPCAFIDRTLNNCLETFSSWQLTVNCILQTYLCQHSGLEKYRWQDIDQMMSQKMIVLWMYDHSIEWMDGREGWNNRNKWNE